MTDIKKLKSLFGDKELLTQALTHKSWVNENPGKRESNERLEFLGDAILEYIVSKELYKMFPKKEEGYLTALRANLVNTQSLFHIANKLGVGKELFLSKGEEEGGGRENPSLLANTTEAIMGALYLDSGERVIYEFLKKNLLSEIPSMVSKPLKDAKSRLQELVQAKGLASPRYKVVKESGPDHRKEFIVEVKVGAKVFAKGTGKNKSLAEQDAANKALLNFRSDGKI